MYSTGLTIWHRCWEKIKGSILHQESRKTCITNLGCKASFSPVKSFVIMVIMSSFALFYYNQVVSERRLRLSDVEITALTLW